MAMHIEMPIDAGDLIYMLIRCRNTLQAAGYADEVEDINKLLDAYYTTQELRRPEPTQGETEDLPF